MMQNKCLSHNTEDCRYYFLDGIRGWGALIVTVYHIIFCSPLTNTMPNPHILKSIFFLNGELAIWIFFIISGFSLSIGYFQTKEQRILARIALARYWRLSLPIFAASLLVYIGFLLNLMPDLSIRPEGLRNTLIVAPDFLDVLNFSFFSVFFQYDWSATLIEPLWTMQYELMGSVITIFILSSSHFFKKFFKHNLLIFIIGVNLFFIYLSYILSVLSDRAFLIYFTFIFGLLMAWLYSLSNRKYIVSFFAKYAAIIFIFTICLAALDPILVGFVRYFFNVVVALLFCCICIFTPSFSKFMSNKTSLFLGKISFSLYLIHIFVIWMAGVPLHNTYNYPIIINILLVAISLLFAVIFQPVDAFSQIVSKKFANYCLYHSRFYR